ncbi:hypothetical protein BDZ85DRAFT_84460 [Elsinoe ampelina]|uniref:Uncharacterized protein n=1 Tax=Elsinoe ampelina TaxID=302913 RepID=A0A6A6GGI5_9PEZI|nr:hypothetical protein BDZ85DRAFT_84460 [Elsinoe ampelina]
MQFQGLDEAGQSSGDLFLPDSPAWLEEGSQSRGYDAQQQVMTTTTWPNKWTGTTASDTSAHLTSINPSAHPLQSSYEPSWWSPVTSRALDGSSVPVPGVSLSAPKTLPRRRSKYTLRRSQSGRAVAIPKAQTSRDDQQPLPMQRWRVPTWTRKRPHSLCLGRGGQGEVDTMSGLQYSIMMIECIEVYAREGPRRSITYPMSELIGLIEYWICSISTTADDRMSVQTSENV